MYLVDGGHELRVLHDLLEVFDPEVRDTDALSKALLLQRLDRFPHLLQLSGMIDWGVDEEKVDVIRL